VKLDNWDDWSEEANEDTRCLFCDLVSRTPVLSLQHVKDKHQFDFQKLKVDWKLEFYDCVKLINFIRRQIYERLCVYCDSKFQTNSDLLYHMKEAGHFCVNRDAPFWKDSQYLLPTYEDDNLLCGFEIDGSDDEDSRKTPATVKIINNNLEVEAEKELEEKLKKLSCYGFRIIIT